MGKRISKKKRRERFVLLTLVPTSIVVLSLLIISTFRFWEIGNISDESIEADSTKYTSTDQAIYSQLREYTTTLQHTNAINSMLNLLEQSPKAQVDSPMVALIIDDFGPGLNSKMVRGFMDLPHNITISIIPGNSHSAKVGRMAARAGKEVFIHLPMEPIESVSMDEPDMVYADADSLTLHNIIARVADELPQAVGMNNHMGPKASLMDELMASLASELNSRNWVFIDSRTVPHSRSLSHMRKAGVPSAGRDIFLDFDRDMKVIKDQLEKTVNIAKSRGWSIGIGHVRKNTLKVLLETLPQYESVGIRFVFITDLLDSFESQENNSMAERR